MTSLFANILLPDSGTNENASHGLIHFRISPEQPVLPGTEYSSAANIHFDFNPPVRTNDAVLIATTTTGIPRTTPNAWSMAPNPVQDVLRTASTIPTTAWNT